MTMHEKLKRLLEMANLSAVARKAGVHQNVIWKALHFATDMRASTVMKVSRALNVDPGWLVDDSKGWPPVHLS